VSNYFKKLSKSANQKVFLLLDQVTSDDIISGQNQNIQLVCVKSGVKFNIWDVVSAV